MSKYRKKPVVVEAIQWNGSLDGIKEIKKKFAVITLERKPQPVPPQWAIITLEGQLDVSKDDWIIKGVKGEVYPCKPDIFELTYEPVAADTDRVDEQAIRKV